LRILRSYEHYLARVRAQTVKAGRAVKFAYRQVGKPYQWGGAGPRTYDCSGLAMAAWRKGGLSLPHRADLQHRVIRRKVGLKHLRPGDLVFFSGDHHVGIYVGRRRFLHAPHTGARVQRGSLTGWRIRAFAGAARPGAPAYRTWPHWVRALADQIDGHATGPASRPHAKDHAAAHPGADTGRRPGTTATRTAPPSLGKVTGDADSTLTPEAVQPPADDAVQPPTDGAPEPPAYAVQPPAYADPLAPVPPAPDTHQAAPTQDGDGHASRPPAAVTGTKHAPQPRTRAHGRSRPRTRSHWPRASVHKTGNDQRFDRDYTDDSSDSDDSGDNDGDNDVIGWALGPDTGL
jgi:hypothetical protein